MISEPVGNAGAAATRLAATITERSSVDPLPAVAGIRAPCRLVDDDAIRLVSAGLGDVHGAARARAIWTEVDVERERGVLRRWRAGARRRHAHGRVRAPHRDAGVH